MGPQLQLQHMLSHFFSLITLLLKMWSCLLSSGFCLADGLASLALRRQGMKFQSGEQPLDWDITGASICYLALESIIYFVLVMSFDLLPSTYGYWTSVKSWFTQNLDTRHYLRSLKGMKEPFIISTIESHAPVLDDEDEDVRVERLGVLSGEATDSIIYLKNLRKVYPGAVNQPEKVAVQSLSFVVHEGECFDFLGTNGAGKSTTLSMLSGEGYPTARTAYIFGKDILSNPKASHQQTGYCPQFDALLELLTVREHLELYARIQRVLKSRFNQAMEEKLTEFD